MSLLAATTVVTLAVPGRSSAAPAGAPASAVTSGDARFEVLSPTLIRTEYAGDSQFETRFRNESETAAKLEHPNIIRIRSVAKTGRHVYFAMDLCPDSLAARVVGSDTTEVKSAHHQGVEVLGEGVVVSGHADDGVVEAIELPGRSYAVGVLWHPEEAERSRVIGSLVREARERMEAPAPRLREASFAPPGRREASSPPSEPREAASPPPEPREAHG